MIQSLEAKLLKNLTLKGTAKMAIIPKVLMSPLPKTIKPTKKVPLGIAHVNQQPSLNAPFHKPITLY